MTSAIELNAYQRGMREGESVGRKTEKLRLQNELEMERKKCLSSNSFAKAKYIQAIIDNVI